MAEKLKCLIIEDEVMARKSLINLCEKQERLQLVKDFERADDALAFLEKESVDLIFLDIELPDMTGLELIDSLSVFPQIIFTTGNKDYAYEAYEYDVTDFLKKPITQPRFQKSVDTAILRQDLLNAVATARCKSTNPRWQLYNSWEYEVYRQPDTTSTVFKSP